MTRDVAPIAASALASAETGGASTATGRVNRKPTANVNGRGRDAHMSASRATVTALLLMLALLMLAGCADDGEAVTIAEYWGLNETPAAATHTPTVTPQNTPTATPTPNPTPTRVDA